MRLTWHIVRKDLIRLRGWIALWLVVLALPIAYGVWLAETGRLLESREAATRGMTALAVLGALVAYLLVVVLVQEDGVVGARQFWTTRPIGGARLLGAKALAAVGIVWGGAVTFGLPWWLWCGFGVGEVGRALIDYAFLTGVVVLPAMLLAVLTDSLGRAILWSVVLIAAVWVWTLPVGIGTMFGIGAQTGLARALFAVGFGLVAMGVVVAARYLGRRRAGVWWAASAIVLVLWLAGGVMPVEEWLSRDPREVNAERGASLQVAWRDAVSRPTRPPPPGAPVVESVSVRFDVQGALAPELHLAGIGARQKWEWDAARFERDGVLRAHGGATRSILGYTLPPEDPETQAWVAKRMEERRAKGKMKSAEAPRVRREDQVGFSADAHTVLPVSATARMSEGRVRYEAKLWLALLRPTLRNEMPFKVGARRAGAGHRMVLHAIQRSPERTPQSGSAAPELITVLLTDCLPQSVTREIVEAAKGREWFRARHEGGYVLLNPQRKEFRSVSSPARAPLHVHGVAIQTWTERVALDRVYRENHFVERPGWMDGVRLAYVTSDVDAVFAREVRSEDFSVQREAERKTVRDGAPGR